MWLQTWCHEAAPGTAVRSRCGLAAAGLAVALVGLLLTIAPYENEPVPPTGRELEGAVGVLLAVTLAVPAAAIASVVLLFG